MNETQVLIDIIKESVSLGVLLVFIFLSYRLLNRALDIMQSSLKELSKSVRQIADEMKD